MFVGGFHFNEFELGAAAPIKVQEVGTEVLIFISVAWKVVSWCLRDGSSSLVTD